MVLVDGFYRIHLDVIKSFHSADYANLKRIYFGENAEVQAIELTNRLFESVEYILKWCRENLEELIGYLAVVERKVIQTFDVIDLEIVTDCE